MISLQLPILAKRSLQSTIDFHGDVGLEPDVFGKVIVRMVRSCGTLLVKFPIKLVAPAWQRIEPVHSLQIDEVIRLLRILQSELGGTAPAVGRRPEISYLYNGTTKKPWQARRNFLRRNPVHINMSLVSPRQCALWLKQNE